MIAAGTNYALVLTKDGNVWAWGDNKYGQLGDGTTITQRNPVRLKRFLLQTEGSEMNSSGITALTVVLLLIICQG
jgi:alpha-tubulin suppressor-like RCC1 family protein